MVSGTLKFVWKKMNELSCDIEKYKRGELSSSQMHELEKRALQDPFLADALEGTEQITSDDFSTDINELNSRIQSKADQKLVASMLASSKPEKIVQTSSNKFIWPLRIAASVLLIIGIFWLAMQLMPLSPTKNMAMKKEEPKPTISAQEKEDINKKSETKHEQSNFKKSELENISSKQSALGDRAVSSAKSIESESAAPALHPKEELEALHVEKSKEQPTADKEAELAMDDKTAVELSKAELKKLSEPLAAPSMAARKKSFSIAKEVIKGRVLSEEDGTPLPGVNVIVQGTSIGTVTDEKGYYQLPSEGIDKNLVFSFIGFQSQTLPVINQQNIDVKLAPDISQLSEVVVVGYGVAKEDADSEPIVKRAEPKGGIRAYDKYLDNNVRYPTEALAKNIKGKVQIRFTVKTDGQLEDFQIVKSLGSGCDEEVVRLVKQGPTWSPTTENNIAVESEVLVKVKFDPAKAKK